MNSPVGLFQRIAFCTVAWLAGSGMAAEHKDTPASPAVGQPWTVKAAFRNRSPGVRGTTLAEYGGNGATEGCVLRALRWLKKFQDADGKWTQSSGQDSAQGTTNAPAMTGLALLAFLAHGETPLSQEFGETVGKGLSWLVNDQDENGHFKGSDTHEYGLSIAAQALCEAYALTGDPQIKEAAAKSVRVILEGQSEVGLWNYNFNRDKRNDTCFSGWCVQALKAAEFSGLPVSGLAVARMQWVKGFLSNYGDGGFGYVSPGRGNTLTPVGVLGLQLGNAGHFVATQSCLDGLLAEATCKWDEPWASSPLYTWYYLTQVKFRQGGAAWERWNAQMSPEFVRSQVIVPKAAAGGGRPVDIGYWNPPGEEHCMARVYSTALCALCLEVYYRYAPETKPRPQPVMGGF